jgi:hypothetical protein
LISEGLVLAAVAQLRIAQVRRAQVRRAQVRLAQVHPEQVRPAQIRLDQVGLIRLMFEAPLIPPLSPSGQISGLRRRCGTAKETRVAVKGKCIRGRSFTFHLFFKNYCKEVQYPKETLDFFTLERSIGPRRIYASCI